jgi:hypothetical protein
MKQSLSQIMGCIYLLQERGGSVGIVTGQGLDDPAGAEDFSSSPCVQTGSGAHPHSYPMGTGGPFPGGKARPGRDADHSPHLMPRSRTSGRYTSWPPKCLQELHRGQLHLFTLVYEIFNNLQGKIKCPDHILSVTEILQENLTDKSFRLFKAGVFLWRNAPERRSGSSFSEGRKPERRSGNFFSCHRYNEVRRVLLSYRSSF